MHGLKYVMTREEAVNHVALWLPDAVTPGGAKLADYLSRNWTTKVGVLLSWEGTTMTVLLRGWDDNEDKYYLFTRTY
jgi:hypothetical protein